MLCSSIKSSKILKSIEYKVILKNWLENGCLKTTVHISELLNLSLETINLIAEDIFDLLLDKSNLLCKSVLAIISSCIFNMLSSIY